MAIIHVDMKMAAKDGYFVRDEKDVVIGIVSYLDADENEVMSAKDMSDYEAERIISAMSLNMKRFVSATLGSLCMIDGEADYRESAYYSNLCVRCGLPHLGPSQALEILSNCFSD